MTKNYRNIIFDLYGTLIDIKTDEKNNKFWEYLSLFYSFNSAIYSIDEIRQKYKDYCKEEINKIKNTNFPEIKIENIFTRLYSEKGIDASKEQIKQTAFFFRISSIKKILLYKGVYENLLKLKDSGKKIFILSNAQRMFSEYELKALNIFKFFDGVYFSSDIKCGKPDICFFNHILNAENLNKDETIMVGNDLFYDIKGASEAGLDTIFIKSNHVSKVKVSVNPTFSITDGNFNKVLEIIT